MSWCGRDVPVTRNRVAVAVGPLSGPKSGRCCPGLRSTVSNRPKRCLCTTLRPCVLGIVSPTSDCASPTRLCCRPNNSWSTPADTGQKKIILIIIDRPTRKIDRCRRPTSATILLLCARKYLGVRTDSQCVARRRAGRELGFYSRRRWGQVPYAQVTGFSAYDERPAVRQQFYRSYIVITLLQSKQLSCY